MGSVLDTALRKLKHISARNSLVSRVRKQVIMRFTNKLSFVYFGHVDQHDDEHHIIRGLTVSSTHHDESYSVGSYDGYDISIVDRHDIVQSPTGEERSHRWLIFEFDLHNNDIPHIFLGGHNHRDSSYAKLFTSVPSMQPVPLGTLENHSNEFEARYSLFANPTQFIEVEKLFTAEVTRTIAAHFWPLAAEIYEGALYVYSDNVHITSGLLDTIFQNGLWLAKQLDSRVYNRDDQQDTNIPSDVEGI